MENLLSFLVRLKEVKIHYSLKHTRDEAVMVLITVPGEHWEVEFFADGSVEIEVFKSNGEIYDEKKCVLSAKKCLTKKRLFSARNRDRCEVSMVRIRMKWEL